MVIIHITPSKEGKAEADRQTDRREMPMLFEIIVDAREVPLASASHPRKCRQYVLSLSFCAAMWHSNISNTNIRPNSPSTTNRSTGSQARRLHHFRTLQCRCSSHSEINCLLHFDSRPVLLLLEEDGKTGLCIYPW